MAYTKIMQHFRFKGNNQLAMACMLGECLMREMCV